MIKVSPSILAADFAAMGDAVSKLEGWGADYVHCDVMDGSYVPNITFGPKMIEDIKKHTNLPLDVHLMIEQPERYVEQFRDAGADIITVHQEAVIHLHRVLGQIKGTGAKCGVVLNPATPVCMVENVLDDVDMILLMSVNPGFGGQAFIPGTIEKIKKLKAMIGDRNIEIEIDGGVSDKNAALLTEAGANVLVMGSAVFNAENPSELIREAKCLR